MAASIYLIATIMVHLCPQFSIYSRSTLIFTLQDCMISKDLVHCYSMYPAGHENFRYTAPAFQAYYGSRKYNLLLALQWVALFVQRSGSLRDVLELTLGSVSSPVTLGSLFWWIRPGNGDYVHVRPSIT